MSRRRVSTSTTAALAPRHKSSHIGQNRGWPGVPNKYRIRSRARVIRPKSIATVVVVFVPEPCSGSTALLAWVIHASVLTGGISDTAATRVVFPTPNPPATTIFADVTFGGTRSGELAKAINDSLQQPVVVGGCVGIFVDLHVIGGGQVLKEHAGDAKRHPGVRRQFRHRLRAERRPLIQPPRLWRHPQGGGGVVALNQDQRVHVQVMAGPGPPAGQHVRTDPGVTGHRPPPPLTAFMRRRSSRSCGVRTWPTASTSCDIWCATTPRLAPSRTSTANPARLPMLMKRKWPDGNLSITWSQPASPTLLAMLLPRLMIPLVIAASGSARSGDMPPAAMSGRPSAETMRAWVTPGA